MTQQSGFFLAIGSLGCEKRLRKLTGALALVPLINVMLPPITTSKLLDCAETSGYARPAGLETVMLGGR